MSVIRPNGLVSSAEISRAEELLGVRFSDDYRQFLELYNGGLFREQLIRTENDETNVIFLGIGGEKDLLHVNQLYLGRIPSGSIVVGMDPGGDLICLSLDQGGRCGSVYYWGAEDESPGQGLDELIELAGSFSGLLDLLEDDA